MKFKSFMVEADLGDDDNLEFGGEELTELPSGLPSKVSFFKVVDSNITSLKGSPEEVETNVLIMGNRKLTSLVGGPAKVNGFYLAHENNLHDLIGAPETCDRFSAHNNKSLSSLVGAPRRVKGDVRLDMNPKLHSLKGIGIEYLLSVGGTLTIGSHVTSHALGLVFVKCPKFDLKFKGAEIIKKYAGLFSIEKQEEAAIDCQHELIEAGFEDLAQL